MDINKDQTSQIEKILYRFKDSKNIVDLMYSLLQEVSVLEKTFNELFNLRNLDDAYGYQLDQIGKIVGEDRNSRDDEEYRKYLYIRTFINNSNGTTKEIEEIIARTEDAYEVQIFNHYPASVYIYIKTPDIPSESLKDLIQNMLPAGVSLGYIGYWADSEEIVETEEEFYELGALELGGGELAIVDPLDLPIFNAFIPYDEVLQNELFELSNGELLELSDQTPLLVSTRQLTSYAEESFLAENPEYETGALHSRPIETV